jgi:hypothetical protein
MNDNDWVDDVGGALEDQNYNWSDTPLACGEMIVLVVILIPVIVLLIVILAAVSH